MDYEKSTSWRLGRSLGTVLGLIAFALSFALGAAMWWGVAVAFKPSSRWISSLPSPVADLVALTLFVFCLLLGIRLVSTTWHLLGLGLVKVCGRPDTVLGRLVRGFFATSVFVPVISPSKRVEDRTASRNAEAFGASDE